MIMYAWCYYFLLKEPICNYRCTMKPVYKRHWRTPENVPFVSRGLINTDLNYMHYSLNGENENDLYRP